RPARCDTLSPSPADRLAQCIPPCLHCSTGTDHRCDRAVRPPPGCRGAARTAPPSARLRRDSLAPSRRRRCTTHPSSPPPPPPFLSPTPTPPCWRFLARLAH